MAVIARNTDVTPEDSCRQTDECGLDDVVGVDGALDVLVQRILRGFDLKVERFERRIFGIGILGKLGTVTHQTGYSGFSRQCRITQFARSVDWAPIHVSPCGYTFRRAHPTAR